MTGFKDAQVQLSRYQHFAGIPCVSNKTLTQRAFLLKKQSNASRISKLLKPNITLTSLTAVPWSLLLLQLYQKWEPLFRQSCGTKDF